VLTWCSCHDAAAETCLSGPEAEPLPSEIPFTLMCRFIIVESRSGGRCRAGRPVTCILRMYLSNYKSVVLPVPELIGGTQKLGRSLAMPTQGEAVGVGMIPFERPLVSSYRPSAVHSNFSSIFTRFRDIAAFVMQNATFPYPTSSLPKIYPCSPGSRWIAFLIQRAKVLG